MFSCLLYSMDTGRTLRTCAIYFFLQTTTSQDIVTAHGSRTAPAPSGYAERVGADPD